MEALTARFVIDRKQILKRLLTSQVATLHLRNDLLVPLGPPLLLPLQLLHLSNKDVEPLHLKELVLGDILGNLQRDIEPLLNALIDPGLRILDARLDLLGPQLDELNLVELRVL